MSKVNPGHYHEVMDRSHIINQMWHQFIQENAACKEDPELSKLAEEIGDKLGEFYQKAGVACFSQEPDKP